MQPTYLYDPELDKEIQWRSKFSVVIPIIIGFLQMIFSFAILGLEIASVIITPVQGTLYAGFWLSVIFTLSWISMFVLGMNENQKFLDSLSLFFDLVCCHRSRSCALIVLLISILCIAATTTLIVLDAWFIGDITRCFFSNAICNDLVSSYTRQSGIPLGRKVQILKGQMACAAALIATALLYMLLFIVASLSSRSGKNRVVIESSETPARVVRQYGRTIVITKNMAINFSACYI